MAEKNEVAQKQEFTTGLSQWTNTITGLVSRDFEQNGVQYDEYSKQCAMNAMGAIFQLVQNTDNGFSDPSTLFNQHTVKRYATYEQNMFRADGTMYFLPKDNTSYWKDGYTCTSLFNNELHIKFVFGYGKSDIKGLTIQFGENYPTKFSAMTDDGTSVAFENNAQVFKTDAVKVVVM